jgi:hypothetical protein
LLFAQIPFFTFSGDCDGPTVGIGYRAQVEQRLQKLESGHTHQLSGVSKGTPKHQKHVPDQSQR